MKLLLTGAFGYTEEQIEHIKSLGYEVTFVQDERVPIEFDVSDIEAVVCNGLFLYTPIEKFKSLKFIQLTSAGLDRVPLDYIKEHNIKILNARGVYSAPMAEFALCGVLQLYKQSRFFYKNQKQHKWEKHRGLLELTDKNVLIVGAGSIGSEVAKRFSAFDANVIGVDLFPSDNPNFKEIHPIDELDNLLKTADIVVLTLPLTSDNEGFFNNEKFCLMKDSSVFVNIARGKLVNQNHLVSALEQCKIAGAVLDVFEEEPLEESSKLWDFDNVIITPHNSFVGENNNKRMFEIIVNNTEVIYEQ
ncbi:MAG: NAD(P)-dependent oxidoreductase [Eubacteriales bacterium]|nr:NAD(P)-dependent oxidoreductase [Eubacteriales bacterium]